MAFIADVALDAAINVLTSNVTVLYICSAEPTSYALASDPPGSGGYKLGTKSSYTLGAVANGAVNGRRTTAPAITDGTVDTTGTATHWALTSGSVLYATGSLSASQAVTSGNTFTLAAFDVTVKDAINA